MRVPKYAHHKPSNRGRVRINGKDFFLGRWNSPASKRRYRELIAQWRAEQNALASGLRAEITVAQLAEQYLAEHVDTHYRKNGDPTSEVHCIKAALDVLLELHASTNAADFGPLALETVRNAMIARDWVRGSINQHVGRIRRMFKWAASRQLIHVHVYQGLETLSGLQNGRCAARESNPVLPVPSQHVESVIPLVSPTVAAMIKLQLACGCRPGEAVAMRPVDLTLQGEVWEYRPAEHKTEHHGRGRIIYLGPQAQSVIRPLLKTDLNAPLFPTPIHGCKYRVDSYRRCIARACRKAGIPVWSPNQLRHNAGTEIRRAFGLEAAQVVLGHSKADVTQVYAERDAALAKDIMRKFG